MITLTNGAQVPENAVQLQTAAAIDGYCVTQTLRLVQYDETLPVAAVQLTIRNQPYTPPTGAGLNVRMSKPDGTTVYNPCLGMDSSGIVYFAFTQQMTIAAGYGTLTVEITDSGVKNSAPIIVDIKRNPVPEGSVESTDEFLTLQELLAKVEKLAAQAASSAAAAKTSETNAAGSASTASAKADDAGESASAAAASAVAAKTSETNAKASETAVKTSETNAKASETAAASSASAAASSASAAKTSASAAASSETNAANSKTAAADSASAAAGSASAAENSASAAAGSQKAAEEKAAQATNAAGNAVAAAGTAAADAAAQAAAKTEQQIRQYADDRYARPLVTKTGPAASLEVYPDRQSNLKVYANGFTKQAGSGDPSPSNVRAITNGGIVLNKTVFNGSENWRLGGTGSEETPYFYLNNAYSGDLASSALYSTIYPKVSIFTTNSVQGIGGYETTCYIRDSRYATVADFKAALQANPLTVWYATTDSTGSLYAPIILTSGEYRATCLPLTAPLCEGDSVVSWAKSGCDKVVTFDGSEDENWETYQNCFVIWGVFKNSVPFDPSGKNENIYANILYQQSPDSSGRHAVGTFYAVNTTESGNFLVVNLNGDTDISAFRAALAAHPLTVWYRSANYTEAADIPVSLETHQRAALVLDGNSVTDTTDEGLPTQLFKVSVPRSTKMPNTIDIPILSNQYKFVTWDQGPWNVDFSISYDTPTHIRIKNSRFATVEDINQNLAAQHASGTPVTIVYQLATPITYAHPAVELPALPDDTGKVTITGQSGGTVTVVFNKSIIKEIAEIKAAMLAMGANLSM